MRNVWRIIKINVFSVVKGVCFSIIWLLEFLFCIGSYIYILIYGLGLLLLYSLIESFVATDAAEKMQMFEIIILMVALMGGWLLVFWIILRLIARAGSNILVSIFISVITFIREVSDSIREQYQHLDDYMEKDYVLLKQELPFAAFCVAIPFYWIITLLELVVINIFRVFYVLSVIGSVVLIGLIIYAIISKYDVQEIMLVAAFTVTVGTFLIKSGKYLTVMAKLLVSPDIEYEISEKGEIVIH